VAPRAIALNWENIEEVIFIPTMQQAFSLEATLSRFLLSQQIRHIRLQAPNPRGMTDAYPGESYPHITPENPNMISGKINWAQVTYDENSNNT
jgi:hypothetical protein